MKSYKTLVLSVITLGVASPGFAQVAPGAGGTSPSTGAPSTTQPPPVSGPADAWAAKPVGTYHVVIYMPGHDMPVDITVKDADGKLAATFWKVGDNDGHDLDATVKGSELVLTGQTPHGLLTINLERRGPKISGTWQLGFGGGALSGEITVPAAEAWSAKPVGAFRVTLDMPTHSMTANVTVKEVDGKLIANVWPVGDNEGHDFDASVMGNQLVIGGQTPRGLFKLTLEHRGSSLSGTWSFGEQKGALTGEIAK